MTDRMISLHLSAVRFPRLATDINSTCFKAITNISIFETRSKSSVNTEWGKWTLKTSCTFSAFIISALLGSLMILTLLVACYEMALVMLTLLGIPAT